MQTNREPYVSRYQKTAEWFRSNPVRLRIFTLCYRLLPVCVVVLYGLLILKCCIPFQPALCFRVILVPLFSFIIVTIIRKWINAPRPYTTYSIEPLIIKQTVGNSFPSRHVFSISIIAMAWFWVDWRMGILLWCMTLILAVLRVIAGVHYIRDVLASMLISLCIGIIFFYLI